MFLNKYLRSLGLLAVVPGMMLGGCAGTGGSTGGSANEGPITIANSELDDLVIMRADGIPTYNFGVVVDDIDMAMTHVIRGDDHVNNTPRQINILKALGASLPEYAHVPMILGSDGARLSKRRCHPSNS